MGPKFRTHKGTQRENPRTQGHQNRAGTSFGHPPGPREVWVRLPKALGSYLGKTVFRPQRPHQATPRCATTRVWSRSSRVTGLTYFFFAID